MIVLVDYASPSLLESTAVAFAINFAMRMF